LICFSNVSNLRRHHGRCKLKDDPDVLKRLLEEQQSLLMEHKKIIEQKDKIIEQKDEIIISQKDTIKHKRTNNKNTNTGVNGNNNKIGKIGKIQQIDNSINITINVSRSDDSTYSFTIREIPTIIGCLMDTEYADHIKREFVKLSEEGKYKDAITMIIDASHNTITAPDSQNILYCKHGEHKGKYMRHVDKEWFIVNFETIIKILQFEIDHFVNEKCDIKTEDMESAYYGLSISDYADSIRELIAGFRMSNKKIYPEPSNKKPDDEKMSKYAKNNAKNAHEINQYRNITVDKEMYKILKDMK